MRNFSDLLGPRQIPKVSRSESEQGSSRSEDMHDVPLIRVDELRRLPDGLAVMTCKNLRGVLLDVAAWTDRADAAAIGAGKKRTESEQFEFLREKYGNLNVK
jgi:type IV secretory pathway TraG/TraD family ATPase VirD4